MQKAEGSQEMKEVLQVRVNETWEAGAHAELWGTQNPCPGDSPEEQTIRAEGS